MKDIHKGLALAAMQAAQEAIQAGDWPKARQSLEVALVTAEAALTSQRRA